MSTNFYIAQISDCHLYASPSTLHYGANVYQNLTSVLAKLKTINHLDMVIFTGDLTQDHSDASYQLFVKAVLDSGISIPFYYLSGNHDEPRLLNQYLSLPPFNADKLVTLGNWQIFLLNSKSPTPAGLVVESEFAFLDSQLASDKHQFILMHHHPVAVDYFIDRHGLQKKQNFWQQINLYPSIKAIACGHVHNALELSAHEYDNHVNIFACPATSIQFDKQAATVANSGLPGGYRVHQLAENGEVNSQAYFL